MRSYLLPVVALAILVTGCSSAPKQSRLVSNQYCHTSQTIETEDKTTVSSRTQVKCSDDPLDRYVPARMGLAKDCYEFVVPINRNGRLVQERGYACQKLDGTYDVVDAAYLR